MSYGIFVESGIIDNDLNTYGTFGVYRVYFIIPNGSSTTSINIPGLVFYNNYENLLGHCCPYDVSFCKYITVGSSTLNIEIVNNDTSLIGISTYVDIVILSKTKNCTNNYYNYGLAVWGSDGSILFNTGIKYAVPLEVYYANNNGTDVYSYGVVTTPSLFGRLFIFTTVIISQSLYSILFSTKEWEVYSNNRYDDTVVFFLNYY